MSPEKLVLLKSRAHRLIEMIAMPIVVLPVWPVMRTLLGDEYSIYYGLFASLALIALTGALSNRWATRFGGEWLTQPERLRRLVAETVAAPRWQNVGAAMVMTPLMLLGFFLILEPLDEFGSSIGGAPVALGILTVVSMVAGGQALLARRQLARAKVTGGEQQLADHYWSQLRRVLPWTYLAYAIGTITGVVLGLQFHGAMRFGIFVGAFLVVSSALRYLFLSRLAPNQLYPTLFDAGLMPHLLLGLLGWGVPMGMAFSGVTMLMENDIPALIVIGLVGIAIVLSALGGLAVGACTYLMRRLLDRQKDRSA
jgi:hypothetical protein